VEIVRSKDIVIRAGSIARDHVHMVIRMYQLELSVSKAAHYLKGKISHKLRLQYRHLRKSYWCQRLLACW
jgi:REP element-mobilizing transposase RayT